MLSHLPRCPPHDRCVLTFSIFIGLSQDPCVCGSCPAHVVLSCCQVIGSSLSVVQECMQASLVLPAKRMRSRNVPVHTLLRSSTNLAGLPSVPCWLAMDEYKRHSLLDSLDRSERTVIAHHHANKQLIVRNHVKQSATMEKVLAEGDCRTRA